MISVRFHVDQERFLALCQRIGERLGGAVKYVNYVVSRERTDAFMIWLLNSSLNYLCKNYNMADVVDVVAATGNKQLKLMLKIFGSKLDDVAREIMKAGIAQTEANEEARRMEMN